MTNSNVLDLLENSDHCEDLQVYQLQFEDGEVLALDDDDSSIQSWITWFCNLNGHDYYLEVPEEFIQDGFNLTGLSSIVPYYTQALNMIMDIDTEESEEEIEEEEEEKEEDDFWNEKDKTPKNARLSNSKLVEPYAFMLYGLIHQRYLLTKNGLRIMAQRFSNGQFGTCPRYYCNSSPVLPVGAYDEVGKESVHLYCPRCLDIYNPQLSCYRSVDGAHFGSTYGHLLFLSYPELVPRPNSHVYQPRLFGFKIHSSQKNQWLRQRPAEYILDDDEEITNLYENLEI